MKTILLILLATLTATAAPDERKPQVPEAMVLYVGGSEGPSYQVDLAEQSLRYRKSWGDKGTVETIKPTVEQWAAFQAVLEEIRAWEWKKSYATAQVKDGTHWSVTMAFRGRKIESTGSNAYPPDFDKYLAAVKALLGGKEFH